MFEAYTVGVRLALTGNVISGLGMISRQFVKTNADAKSLQRHLDKIKLTMMAGGVLFGAGAFGFSLIGKAVKPASEYAHQLAQMRIAGMKNLEIAQATAKAWKIGAEVPTATAAENLAAIRELRMVFGNTGHAIENVATIQKIQAVLSNVMGGGGGDQAYSLAKALEMKGAVRNPHEFNVQADLITKAIIAGGGKIQAGDFLSAFKYGRAATQGWSDQFAYTILPTLIQEMKSAGGGGGTGGPGNALMSAYSAVVGGTVPQKALKEWQSLGLLDASKVVWNRVGSAKGLRPGAIKGSDLFQQNPFAWAQNILLPAMLKKGITDEKNQRQVLQYLFPNRTAGFVMQQMTLQGWKFTRDQKLIGQAQGLAGYNELLKTDPQMAALALHKQWQNMLATIGYQIMPTLVKSTLYLVDTLRAWTAWAQRHPATVKILTWAFIGLSSALMFGGTVLLLKGAFEGLALVIGGGKTAGSLISSIAVATGGLSRLASVLGVVGVGAYLWDKSPSSTGKWGAFWNDGHFVEKRLGLYSGPRDKWDDEWEGKKAGSPYVPSKSNMSGYVVNLHMDGKKVGEGVLGHINKAMGLNNNSASFFDPNIHVLPVGAGAY
jgi:hypothetical protein